MNALSLKTMALTTALLSALCLFAHPARAQQTGPVACAEVKTGQFYYYSGSAGEVRSISVSRDSLVQKEINGKDTTSFKTSWVDDCLLKLVFIHSSKKMEKEEADFYKLHSAFAQIVEVKPEYYLFKVSLDSVRPSQTSVDTMWRKK